MYFHLAFTCVPAFCSAFSELEANKATFVDIQTLPPLSNCHQEKSLANNNSVCCLPLRPRSTKLNAKENKNPPPSISTGKLEIKLDSV